MIEKEIIFLLILPFAVSALSLEETLLQLLKQNNHQGDNSLKWSLSEKNDKNPLSKSFGSEKNYEALTQPPTGLNNKLLTWLNDDKVDSLIHHLEAIENLTRDHDADFNVDLGSESEERNEDVAGKPRSEVQHALQNCGVGKICIDVQMQEVNEKPSTAKYKAAASNKDSVSSSADDDLVMSDSDSSTENSFEAPKTKTSAATTLATAPTTTARVDPQAEGLSKASEPNVPYSDLDEWIPYRILQVLKETNSTMPQGILDTKKFARVGPLIFADTLPKAKESNEYDVKDIKQLIVTNTAQGEPRGIIVAENRKFSLDYIDLENLRSHDDNTTVNEETQIATTKQQKVQTENVTETYRGFRKSTKKKNPVVTEANKHFRSEKNETVARNATEKKALRTIAQKRKALKAAAKKRFAKNKKKKDSWGDSSDNSDNDSDGADASLPKQSESAEAEPAYKPKRFQIAKSKSGKSKAKTKTTKKTAKKPASMYSPEDKSTQTFEALSEEITTKKPPKRLKSKARIPGKPEHYIQNIDRIYKEGMDFRRLRMQQFMPKRYHWDPSEFSHLGYLWFNGHQGKNPPGNFKIAYK